ncbi:hypothetical protein [Burkholderia gladioli]|uniref:hypothetical protein n=1 Tax=Burkholderia gladioli TaxID=28095 RepID=UPI0011D1F2A8|nr:hypothetical protein [Burkholderia gladioli]MBW5281372.1 hypothetical protein [Burkholderia gladioli]
MIDAHSSWIGLRASQGVAGSMPRHGTGPVGKRYLIGRCMRLAHSWLAGWLARFQAWRGETSSCHGFRARRWNYFLEIDDFFLEVVNN